jgi:hypothetical protein
MKLANFSSKSLLVLIRDCIANGALREALDEYHSLNVTEATMHGDNLATVALDNGQIVEIRVRLVGVAKVKILKTAYGILILETPGFSCIMDFAQQALVAGFIEGATDRDVVTFKDEQRHKWVVTKTTNGLVFKADNVGTINLSAELVEEMERLI